MSERASVFSFLRQRRLERAKLRLADAEHNLRKWGFANTPSEDARAKKRIAKMRRKLEELGE
jgi:hypothetical protein